MLAYLIILRRAALVAALAGAVGSVGFMLYAGRRNPSRLLVLLFAAWVLSPFVAAVLTWRKAERWSTLTRATLYGTTLFLALVSLYIYGEVALGHLRAKIGFIFLVVPLASWLAFAIAVLVVAIVSRRLSTTTDRL